jgi:hypothetical protein
MTRTVEWFMPERRSFEWFGPTAETLASVQRGGTSVIASVIGPPGAGSGGSSITPGPGFALVGAEIRYAISTLTRA